MAGTNDRVRVALRSDAPHAGLRTLLNEVGAVEVSGDQAEIVIASVADLPKDAPEHVAVLALVEVPADSDRAWHDGATHLLPWPSDAATLARTLGMAARFARRGMALPAPPAGSPIAVDGAGAPRSIAIVALTRFEVVNAAFGRDVGDAVLQFAEQRIADIVRDLPHGRIERRRGAEFIVHSDADPATLRTVADRLSTALARPFAIAGEQVTLGSRIGAAQRWGDEDRSSLLRRAGEALQAVRTSDAAPTYTGLPRGTSLARLAADLHRALERDEITVRFQPQATLASGRIVGVEALARWEHPRLGALGAEALLAAAGRADLGTALSERIHTVALALVRSWPERHAALRVALNVTADDLVRPDFVERFLARIEASGVARARITAEITESGLIGDLPAAADVLARLRGAGCRIAIDDFGTGYSSLAYLQSLPLDYLKIDRRLAQDIAGSERDRVVVRGVIAIARALGLETVAEGVETAEQRALLADEGCTYYQGFLCAPPLDDPALIALLEG